jgi:hypothetical protein
VASGLTNVGFNWAVTVGDVVRVVLLFYLMPPGRCCWPGRCLLRLVLALAGVVLVLKPTRHGLALCPRACPTGWR